MATFDYASLVTTVDELLTEFGREITLIKLSETPNDTAKPWNGPISDNETVTFKCAQLLPNQVRIFGLSALGESTELTNMINHSDIVYVGYGGQINVGDYTYVEDGGVQYLINATQELKPADTVLLNYIGVNR